MNLQDAPLHTWKWLQSVGPRTDQHWRFEISLYADRAVKTGYRLDWVTGNPERYELTIPQGLLHGHLMAIAGAQERSNDWPLVDFTEQARAAFDIYAAWLIG